MKGPFVLKYDRKYYLMYSANYYASWDYAVGYAVSENPMGPFLKAAHNPVLFAGNSQFSGPGHNSVTMSPNGKELFIVYHVHTNAHGRSRSPSGDRQVCIDRMGFRADGSLYVSGPIHTPQPIPSSQE